MSYAIVYRILPNGSVKEYETVKNGMAGAHAIWTYLAKKAGFRTHGDEAQIWMMFGSSRFTREENICLGFTFDGAYVKRENMVELYQALQSLKLTPTVLGLGYALEKLWNEPDHTVRGACFQQTSVSDNPWRIKSKRSFNFDKDTLNAYNAAPFEIIDELAKHNEP